MKNFGSKVSDQKLNIEVAFGTSTEQCIVEVELAAGATIQDAVQASGLQEAFPTFDFTLLRKGVWNVVKGDEHCLKDGDRVEVYRPLIIEPKEMRRRRAEKGRD